MAVFGLHLLTQDSRYWAYDDVEPVTIKTRWEYGYKTDPSPLGQTIQYTGRVFCSQRVIKGGVLLEGELDDEEMRLLDNGKFPSQLSRSVVIAEFYERTGIGSEYLAVYEARF